MHGIGALLLAIHKVDVWQQKSIKTAVKSRESESFLAFLWALWYNYYT